MHTSNEWKLRAALLAFHSAGLRPGQLSAPPPPRPAHLLFRHRRTVTALSCTVLRVPLEQHPSQTAHRCGPLRRWPSVPPLWCHGSPMRWLEGQQFSQGCWRRGNWDREAGWWVPSQGPAPCTCLVTAVQCTENGAPPVRRSRLITCRSPLPARSCVRGTHRKICLCGVKT